MRPGKACHAQTQAPSAARLRIKKPVRYPFNLLVFLLTMDGSRGISLRAGPKIAIRPWVMQNEQFYLVVPSKASVRGS